MINKNYYNNLLEAVVEIAVLNRTLEEYYLNPTKEKIDELARLEMTKIESLNRKGYALGIDCTRTEFDEKFDGMPSTYILKPLSEGNDGIRIRVNDAVITSKCKKSIQNYKNTNGVDFNLIKFIFRTSSYNFMKEVTYMETKFTVIGYYLGGKDHGYAIRYKLKDASGRVTDIYEENIDINS